MILDSDNGNITLGNGNTTDTALNVSVQSGQTVNGNILITNYEAGAANDINNDINIYSALRATGNIKVVNQERDVNVVSGTSVDATKVELYAYGDVKNNASIHSAKQVYLVAGDDIRNEASITSGKDLILWSMKGDIENEGTIEAAEKIDMDATWGNVYNFAGITSTNDAVDILAGNSIINLGDNANDAITAKGAVMLDAGVALINTAKIVSTEDNVTIQADSGVMNLVFTDYKGEGRTNQNGSIEAKGNVVIETTNKEAPDTSAKVYNSADIKAEGNVDIDAYGSLYNSGNITAVKEVHLDSWKSDLHNTGDIVSEQGNVRLYANQNLYNGTEEDKDGNVTAKNQIELIAYKGNLINYGNMESRTSSVALTGGEIYETELNNNREVVSDITNYGSITAAEAVLVRTVNGNINNHKQITSQNSTVTIKAEQHKDYNGQTLVGDIKNGAGEAFDQYADITAAKGISLQAASDIHNVGDYLVTSEGDITVTAGRDVENIGNYTLNKSGKISVDAGRDLINEGNFFTPQGDITMTSGEDVLNMGVMEAVDGAINIISKDGVIYNEAGADLLSGNGDVTLRAESTNGYYYYFNDGDLVEITEADIKTNAAGELYYENAAGDKFAVVKNGSVFNAGDILALNGTITLEAVKGNLTNYDDFNSLMDAAGNKSETYKASNAQGLDGTGVDIATGNIVFKAEHGSLYNDKVLESGESITLTAAKGLTNFAYNVYAGKDITLTATEGDVVNSATLESYAGNVTLHAENGNVINGVQNDITVGKGDIITYGGNVTLLAEGYDAAGNAGSVTNYGDIIATNTNAADKLLTGSIILESQHGNVDNFDDFNTYNVDGVYYKDYVADNHGSIYSNDYSYNIANNNLTISAKEGKIYNSKDYLVALGDVTLEAKTGLSSFGTAIYAGKNITLSATEGDLFNKAELLSVEGDIKLQAEKGTVVNLIGGDMIARNGNVILESGADASNTVKVVDAIGNAKTLADLVVELYPDGSQEKAEAIRNLNNAGDSILITKQYYKDSTGAWIELAKTNEGEVVAPSTASEFKTEVFYLEGDNRNNQQLITEIVGDKNSGLVEAYRTGDVVNRGDIVAQGTAADKGAVTLHSLKGNTTNYDNFKLLNGKSTYDYLGANTSGVDAEINTIIARFNPNTEYFYDAKGILISDSDMNLLADEGSLYNNMNIISEKDVNLTSGKDLSIGNSVASVIAKGNVIAKSTAGHVINDSHVESQEGSIVLDGEKGVTSQVGAANLSAVNGSISVVTTYGEINIDELVAGEMAAAGTKDAGSINIGKIKGEDVVLYTENAATTIKITDSIQVKDHLLLQGNSFTLPKIDRPEGAGGTLIVDVNGIGQGGSGAMTGDLSLDIDGDVRFTTMNVTNATVNIGGKLSIDKLHVGGAAHFTSLGFVTGVYGGGTAPYHDSSNALYYDLGDGSGAGYNMRVHADDFRAIKEGEPEEVRALTTMKNLKQRLSELGNGPETFNKDNGGWMNLYVDSPRYQRSNGLLLHIGTGYRSANQRWSAEDLSAKLVDFKSHDAFMTNYGDASGIFGRYDLVDMPARPIGDILHSANSGKVVLQKDNNGLRIEADKNRAEEEENKKEA
ncbi:MAG: beta strand repeat-containing protein [Phascolarctobacterium sp.]